MKLTPMDIKNKEFKKGFRGYDSEEVDEFINEIIDNYEELYKENSRLKENLSRSNEKLEHYVKIENTIQNTLLLAQNAAEQARESSQKESDMILKNANESAKKIIDKAHNDVILINDEYEKVKQEFIKFRAKFRNFMNAQTETFDELEKDLTKVVHYGLCHNDLNTSNILYSNDSTYFIDFEFAGMGDVFFDLATISWFLEDKLKDELIKSYFGYFNINLKKKLKMYLFVVKLWNATWSFIKSVNNTTDYDYKLGGNMILDDLIENNKKY